MPTYYNLNRINAVNAAEQFSKNKYFRNGNTKQSKFRYIHKHIPLSSDMSNTDTKLLHINKFAIYNKTREYQSPDEHQDGRQEVLYSQHPLALVFEEHTDNQKYRQFSSGISKSISLCSSDE